MRQTLFIMLLLIVATGCERGNSDVAAAGVAPTLGEIPIGPIPGPATQQTSLANVYTGNTVAITEGRKLFVAYNCYGCHGGRGGGGMGPSLRDQVWRYGDSDAHVFDSISRGRGQGMPAWGLKIPQQQIWKVVAYVKSLRTPLEPNAPHTSAPPDTPEAPHR